MRLKKGLQYLCFVWACMMLVFAASCNKEQVCFIPTNVTGKMAFSVKEVRDTLILTDSNVIDTTIISFRDTAMTAHEMRTFTYDTNYVIYGIRGQSIISFSLDPDLQTIQYKVVPDNNEPEMNDTLTVKYDSYLYFISNDCGFTYNYKITSVHITNHYLDSSAVITPEVTTEGSKQHIRLYFFK